MFKFLRRYNKWILAVGGTLLMITFLIPFAFTELGKMRAKGSAVWARLADHDGTIEVTSAHAQQAAADLEIMRGWLGYVAQASAQQKQLPSGAMETATQLQLLTLRLENRKFTDEHWFLLVHEAEQAGLIGGPSEAAGMMAADDADALINALARQIASRSGPVSLQSIQETLARIRGVGRLLTMYRDAGHYSDRRLLGEARRMFHSVLADFIVIEASAAKATSDPTEEQLAAQLEKYGDVKPGEGEHGFGYRLPNRVRLEWITVYSAAIRGAIEKSDRLSQVEQRKHWKKNENNPDFGPPDASRPVPVVVREDLLKLLTAQSMDEVAKFAVDQLRLSRRGIPMKQGYLQPPADWREVPLGNLALEIASRFNIELPVHRTGPRPWLTDSDLNGLSEIGGATTTAFGQPPLGLATLAMNCKEFNGNPTYGIQEGVSGPPLRHEDGSVFIWRIIRADPSRKPAAVDEVRDALLKDLRRLGNYDSLVASLDSIRTQAVDQGMLATALAHQTAVRSVAVQLCDFREIQKAVQMRKPLRPMPSDLPVIGNDENVAAAMIDLGLSLPMTAKTADLPRQQRTVAMPVPEKLCIALAQLTDQRPLTTESFTGYYMRFQDLSALLSSRDQPMEQVVLDAFSYESLAKRHRFAKIVRDTSDESGG